MDRKPGEQESATPIESWGRLGPELTSTRPVRELHRRWTDHVGDALFRGLARLGVGPASLLTTTGRRTGRSRRTPVIPVRHGDRRWLVAPYGNVSWVLNATRRRAGRPPPRAPRRHLHDPRGRRSRGWADPQAVRRSRQRHPFLLPGGQGGTSQRVHRRGSPPSRFRTHCSRCRRLPTPLIAPIAGSSLTTQRSSLAQNIGQRLPGRSGVGCRGRSPLPARYPKERPGRG